MADLDDLLLKTSRTFALSIPLLPEPTRREVGIAYLLFRIADTLEDATRWDPTRQGLELDRFARALESPDVDEVSRLARSWTDDPPLDHDGYMELLGETPAVIEALLAQSPEARALIVKHTVRTSERMASFVARRPEGGELRLDDIEDLKGYCYAVAGIVGEMLTELFVLGSDELQPAADVLRRDAATFGEALQLVNILKDCSTDLDEGRSYLPAGVDRGQVFALARDDLDTATAYCGVLQEAGAPRGVVEFCAVPVLLARATLDRVEADGPGSKLTREEVATIVLTMNDALDHGRPAVPPRSQAAAR